MNLNFKSKLVMSPNCISAFLTGLTFVFELIAVFISVFLSTSTSRSISTTFLLSILLNDWVLVKIGSTKGINKFVLLLNYFKIILI